MAQELMAGAGWLDKRSGVLTGLAMGLAALATAATFAYLNPAENDTWTNLAVGDLLLIVPLVATLPLKRHRLYGTALLWLVAGFLGSYFFGTPVLFAGLLLGASLAVEAVLARGFGKYPRAASMTNGAGTVSSRV